MRLEPEFWQYLAEIAYERQVTRSQLVSVINCENQHSTCQTLSAKVFSIFRRASWECFSGAVSDLLDRAERSSSEAA
ncbi:MAG: ribbon-helix-helix domain-containing protein [Stellaceae bacterium]